MANSGALTVLSKATNAVKAMSAASPMNLCIAMSTRALMRITPAMKAVNGVGAL